VSLVAEGREHLLSAFPTERPFVWANPWFGGIHPCIYWAGDPRLAREKWSGEPVRLVGATGLEWTGVRVRCAISHRDLSWLGVEADYLTLPDSNIVCLLTRWTNHSRARLRIPERAGVGVWLAVGGSREHSALHFANGGDTYTQQRGAFGSEVSACDWGIVTNLSTGDALTLAPGGASTRIAAEDMANEGPHLGAYARLVLGPGETRAVIAWLVVTRGMEAARRYDCLRRLDHLP
jgi:hypothetical protein